MIMLILIFNILMATTFTFSKAALWYLSPIALITIRFLVSGTCMLGFLCYTNPAALYISVQDWHLFFAIMLIPFYGSFVLDNWSLQFISSSKSCLIYNLMPLISAIIAYIGFKRKITSLQWIILFFGFVSLIPILKHDAELSLSEGSYIPEMALLISVALAAWGWLLIQQLLVSKNYNLLFVNGVGLFGAGLISGLHLTILWTVKTTPILLPGICGFLPFFYMQQMQLWRSEQSIKQKYTATLGSIVGFLFALFVIFVYKYLTYLLAIQSTSILWQPNEHDQLFHWLSTMISPTISYWMSFSFYVGWLIVACHLIGYTLYSYLLKKYSATFLAFAGSTIPLVAATLGYMFLNEPMPTGFIQSFILMTSSLCLFYSQEN